ncbi:MAG: hypothetical protein LW855_00375 [Alphaproteobacteria bacterium]|jgi:hypothetical protein|nr:hypothetical protein [Alphaproteobacteria bacterium]
MLGYIAGIIADSYDRLKEENSEADDEQLLIAAIQQDLDGKVLVGPTTGSFGIGLYVIAKMLRGEKFKLNDRPLNVNAVAVIAPQKKDAPKNTLHEMAIDKAQVLLRLHQEQGFFECGTTPPVYRSRADRIQKASDIVVSLDGRGIFTPTNPSRIEDIIPLITSLVGETEHWHDIPLDNQKQLTYLGVVPKTETLESGAIREYLEIIRPFGDGILGSAMSIDESVAAYAKKYPNKKINIRFPMSAGPGAVGLQYVIETRELENVRVTATPDPNNNTWVKYFTEYPVDKHPVINRYTKGSTLNLEGDTAPTSNGMGSNADVNNPSSFITAKGLENDTFNFEFSTDVMRMLARPIHAVDVLAGDTLARAATYPEVSAGILKNEKLALKVRLALLENAQELYAAADGTPLPELASATPLAALLCKHIESLETQAEIESFATRAAAVLRHGSISEETFTMLATRGDPRKDDSVQDVWSELENLADIQGQTRDGDNKTAVFVRALRAAFGLSLEALPKPLRTPDADKEIVVIQETGYNAPAMFDQAQESAQRKAQLEALFSQSQLQRA